MEDEGATWVERQARETNRQPTQRRDRHTREEDEGGRGCSFECGKAGSGCVKGTGEGVRDRGEGVKCRVKCMRDLGQATVRSQSSA
jgi:hypothetical protein